MHSNIILMIVANGSGGCILIKVMGFLVNANAIRVLICEITKWLP